MLCQLEKKNKDWLTPHAYTRYQDEMVLWDQLLHLLSISVSFFRWFLWVVWRIKTIAMMNDVIERWKNNTNHFIFYYFFVVLLFTSFLPAVKVVTTNNSADVVYFVFFFCGKFAISNEPTVTCRVDSWLSSSLNRLAPYLRLTELVSYQKTSANHIDASDPMLNRVNELWLIVTFFP